MTGTALTEQDEFNSIYNLDIIEIPTNKPLARIDEHDWVFKTEQAKFNAVINEIISAHERVSPCLWAPFPSKNPKCSASCFPAGA